MGAPFRDREHAGRELADRVVGLGLTAPVVLGLPRGGVVVAAEVARRLGVPVDVLVTRKIGAPGHPEFGIGAVAEDSDVLVTTDAAAGLGLGRAQVERLAAAEREEVRRRVAAFRGDRALPDVTGRDVVVVDDGLATGVTAEAALLALRARHPRRLVLAVPVGAPDAADRLATTADDVVCLHRPRSFAAVGQWYADFTQTTDDDVLALLRPPSPDSLQ